jgi:hypothetical protein
VFDEDNLVSHAGPVPVIRAGGMKRVFDGVYANATLGIFLREFTHGHTRQLAAVLRRHLIALAARTLTRTARYATARGATLRTHLVNIPARLARPQRQPTLHLPAHWPRAKPWLRLWTAVFAT